MYKAVAEDVGLMGGPGKAPPVEGGPCAGKRKLKDEESHDAHQELWEKYMEVEHSELEQRRNGQLGRDRGGERQGGLDPVMPEPSAPPAVR